MRSSFPAAALGLLLPWSLTVAQVRLDRPPAGGTPAPTDWAAPGGDVALTRHSPLTQITPANIADLRVAWSFATGSIRGHEGNPLVVGSRLFLHTPHPNAVYAFDLEHPGGAPLWKYSAPPSRDPALAVCCDVTSRGIGWHPSGKLYVPLFPGDLAALDATTGKEIWRVRNGDPRTGLTMPAAPLVAGDIVVVGVAGGEFGARGYLTAYDALTGKLLWRAYSTGTDQDVGIAGPANPHYPSHQGGDLGTSTWTGDSWRRGGGATLGWLSHDPDLGLVYYGTGAPAPLNPDQRTGDNKWTSSLVARELATGRVRWALQLTPRDAWGFDASNESILTDLTLDGRPVKALVHFDRNGFAYTVDRVSGRVLRAEKFGPVNWASRVDLQTATPLVDPRYLPATGRKVSGVCPALAGMKGLAPAAYAPETGLFYVPVNNLCMDIEPTAAAFTAGQPFLGATVRMTRGPGGNRGRFIAWDAVTGAIAWEAREPFPVLGGALVTASGLVFYGTLDGWLKALDARTGQELWRFKTPSGIVGNPISFLSPDGRQQIAVVSGVGGWAAPALTAPPNASPTAGLGVAAILADLLQQVNPGGVLLVFSR
jgi:PQQ-dependent dehydrogenase (methanol/ethanol family)